MLLVCPRKRQTSSSKASHSYAPVFSHISDGYMAFRGCHWVVVNGNGLLSQANAPGWRGMFFVSNVLYFVHRVKNYAQKSAPRKLSTCFVSFVSFCLKSVCNQNPAMNPAMNPPKTRQAAIFLPNYQGILVRPIGVV